MVTISHQVYLLIYNICKEMIKIINKVTLRCSLVAFSSLKYNQILATENYRLYSKIWIFNLSSSIHVSTTCTFVCTYHTHQWLGQVINQSLYNSKRVSKTKIVLTNKNVTHLLKDIFFTDFFFIFLHGLNLICNISLRQTTF